LSRSGGRGPERWGVRLQKPEIFLLQHLPSIHLVKAAPVEAGDDEIDMINEISDASYKWRWKVLALSR